MSAAAADSARPGLTLLDRAALADVTRGGLVLAGGAGQGPHTALLTELMCHVLGAAGAVPVVPARDLPGDAWVAHVALRGSPLALSELPPSGLELSEAARALAAHRGVELTAVAGAQVGGMNVVAGALAAHDLGLPVVDGDLAGRSFPGLAQLLLGGTRPVSGPVALQDPRGNAALVECGSITTCERLVEAGCAGLGGWVAMALCLVRAGDLARDGVGGSLTRAWRIGRALAPPVVLDPARLVAATGGEVVFRGTITEARRSAAPARPWAIALEAGTGEVARVDAREQFLAAAVNGRPVATTPDVICLLTDAGTVVDVDTLRPGLTVSIARFTLDPRWYSPAALTHIGPAALGIGPAAAFT